MPADAASYPGFAEHTRPPNRFRMLAEAALGGKRSGRRESGDPAGPAVASEPVEGNCEGAEPSGRTGEARRGRDQETRSSSGPALQQDAGEARQARRALPPTRAPAQ